MTQHFDIAPPPSANKIWRNVNGRTLKSREYRRWLDLATWEIRIQQIGPALEGPAVVSMSLRRPRANADIDNRIKPVLDALESGGALVNDKQVTCITAAWADHDGCRVTVGKDLG